MGADDRRSTPCCRPRGLAAVGVGLVLAACGTAEGTSDDLVGTTFVGEDVTGHDLVAGTEITLSFDDDNLSASAGCNSLGADIQWQDDTLVTTEVWTTMMGCNPALHEQDDWLVEVLTGSPQVTREGDTLRVVGEGARIILVAEADAPLEGSRWLLEGLVEGESVSSLPASVTASLMIDDGTLAAELGCNTGSTNVTIGETTLELGQVTQTKMACLEPQLVVEHHMTRVLRDTVDWDVDGTTLALRNGEYGLHLRAASAHD